MRFRIAWRKCDVIDLEAKIDLQAFQFYVQPNPIIVHDAPQSNLNIGAEIFPRFLNNPTWHLAADS